MKEYIGCKIVKAEPCKAWKSFNKYEAGSDGYKISYSDGSESWAPKKVFEEAYIEIPDYIEMTQEEALSILDLEMYLRK